MSQPNAPRIIHDDVETIEGAIAAMFTRHERVLVALLPPLEEPGIVDPDLALAQLRFRVETLAGFVVGAAVRAASRAGRGLPEGVQDRAGLLLGRTGSDGKPAMVASEIVLAPSGSSEPPQLPPDAVGAGLPDFTAALGRLASAATPALTFFDRLTSSWQHYTAEVNDLRFSRRAKAKRKESGSQPWLPWTRRLRRTAAPGTSVQGDLATRFLLRAPRPAREDREHS